MNIRTRLVFSHLIVIILVMGVSGFLLLSFLQQYFLRATEDSLRAQAHITAQALIPGARVLGPIGDNRSLPANNIIQQQVGSFSLQAENLNIPASEIPASDLDLSYLTNASLQLGTQLDTRIRILDSQGGVLIDSQQEQYGQVLTTTPWIAQALAGQSATNIEQNDEIAVLHLAMPTFLENELIGVVYLSQPLSDVYAVLQDLRTRWALSTVIAVLLSTLAGFLLAGAITDPLRHLTRAAGIVAQGNFDQQVNLTSKDELGQLGGAFNEMTARLRAARQMQIDFIANVSHELRTPLTSIKGMVETLSDGAVNDFDVRDDFLGTIEEETDRLIRLVNDLLTLTEVDSVGLNLQRQSVDLIQLVRGTLDQMAHLANQRNLSLSIETAHESLQVEIDPDRLEQVLVNLLDNAIKFSHPGGVIKVIVEVSTTEEASVQVIDGGKGIPAVDLPHIGERFYRADKARSRGQGGSGLGIAIAKSIIQAHGGRLWLNSEEGVGTQVGFSLPVA